MQIQRFFPGEDIGNIGYPELFRFVSVAYAALDSDASASNALNLSSLHIFGRFIINIFFARKKPQQKFCLDLS